MSEDALAAPGVPPPAGASSTATAARAARIRELERRAFARPGSPVAEAAAAAAVAELARLRDATAASSAATAASTPATPARSARPPQLTPPASTSPGHPEQIRVHGEFAEELDALDDPPALGERITVALTTTAATLLARARSLTRRDHRRLGMVALALGLFASLGGVIHAVLVAPPPAYEIFDGARQTTDDEPIPGDIVTFEQSLHDRGTLVLSGPHLFGDLDDTLRLAVYREWIDDSIIDVCAAIVVGNEWTMSVTCAGESTFRAEGVSGTYESDGLRLDYFWAPDGSHSITDTTEGAETLDEIRALGIPALDALETVGEDVPLAQAVYQDPGGVLAGPLLLGEVDGWTFAGALVRGTDAFELLVDDRPQFCLLASDGSQGTRSCARPERFREVGIDLQVGEALLVTWYSSGAFRTNLP